ncbi:MAG: polymer-forming cytoskeletal protein [Mangrovibacterium sp.]
MAKTYDAVQQVFTIIGKGTKVTGDMNVEGDTRIDGELEGTINCSGRLIVGLEGKVQGDIFCVNFETLGEVNGNLTVKEKTFLREKSNFQGKLLTNILNIEPGAKFTGTCDMSGENIDKKKEDTKEN